MQRDLREARDVSGLESSRPVVSRLQRQMLHVFYRTDPRAGRAPASAPVEAQLDFFLTPPER